MRRTMPIYLIAASVVLVFCLTTIGFAQDDGNGGQNGNGNGQVDQNQTAAEENGKQPGEKDVPKTTKKKAGPLEAAWQSFKTKWQLGGLTMWALAFLAVVAVVFIIDRLVSLRRGKIVPKGLADRANKLWQQGQYEEVVKLGKRSGSTLGRIIVFLARHRNNSYQNLTDAAEDIAARDFELQVRGNYPLNAVGTVAPLLGLLGTVFGLLGAFATIGVVGSMDDPSELAGDIGEALITTAGGLILAIPTLSLYHFFANRTMLFAGVLGEEVSGMIQDWFLTKADEESAPTARGRGRTGDEKASSAPVKSPPSPPKVDASEADASGPAAKPDSAKETPAKPKVEKPVPAATAEPREPDGKTSQSDSGDSQSSTTKDKA